MSVISVIPETGFVPTVAIARAATVVKRNEMTMTTRERDERLRRRRPAEPPRTPKRKKSHVASAHDEDAAEDEPHREVAVGALGRRRRGPPLAAEQLLEAEAERLGDDPPAPEDAHDPGRGDGADADVPDVAPEDRPRPSSPPISVPPATGGIGDLKLRAEVADERDEEEPGEERAGADDRRVAQADDVAEAHDRGEDVELEDELRLLGEPVEERDASAT